MYYKPGRRHFSKYSSGRFPEEDKAGNLYYVRLKTPQGPFYKLGFTTMLSVKDRFAFQNKGHEAQIDGIFGFVKSQNALSIEKMLHVHFQQKAIFPIPDDGMPFFGNGQSELYVEDILGMDEDYTPDQANYVRIKMREARLRRTGHSDAAIEKTFKEEKASEEDFQAIVGLGAVWPINWLIRYWLKIDDFLFANEIEKAQKVRVEERIRWFKEQAELMKKEEKRKSEEARAQRIRKISELKKEIREDEEAEARAQRIRKISELKKEIREAEEATFSPDRPN